MKIHFLDQNLKEIDADLEIVFVVHKDFDHRWIKRQKALLEKLGFKGEAEETVLLPESVKLIAAVDTIDREHIRLAAAAAVKAVKGTFPRIKVGLYLDGSDKTGTAAALAEGLLLGDYRFDTYKSKKSENRIQELYISRSEYSNRKFDSSQIEAAIERAIIHCETVNTVRDIINTPPEEATPEKLAARAGELAAEQNVQCRVYDENWIRESGMGAFHAVGKASDNPPRLIHLTYTPRNPRARVALVGKGITYDTGGLSLKPTSSMTTMKADKSGAVTVLGILLAASRMQLDIELHGVLGAAENMVSGSSYRPDDVLTARNGKTIEVKNTDAEGRLVLADCLCYAQDLEPDYIVDMATLTGGCVIALGEYTFGVLGHSEELKESILSAARSCGELAHSLPFNRYLKKLLKSDVADVPNTGGTKYGSASIAGLFLSEFIEEKYRDRWVHLDIAGPAFVEKPWAFNPAGASGVGVRTMLAWLEGLR
ncbi:MAG: leucyl aminopeptidase [Spirochaetota bacterium]|nr:leucyl aminopeptidase [Spirochaetota bacterium]